VTGLRRFTRAVLGDAPLSDLAAAIGVGVVALPLNAAIATASGVPAELGLASAVMGALIVGLLCGRGGLYIAAPAASLALAVWGLIRAEPERGFAFLGTAVALAGLIQMALGVARVASWFKLVGPSVLRGVMSGVGVSIMASQLFAMVDMRPNDSALADLLSASDALVAAVAPAEGTTHHLAAVIGLGGVAAMALFAAFRPRRWRAAPVPLAGLVAVVALAHFTGFPVRYLRLSPHLLDELRPPHVDRWAAALVNGNVLVAAVSIALVSTVESLLCASKVEDKTGRRVELDRMLIALGAGNICCGLVGGLPITAAVVRTTLGLEAGTHSRRAAILHGLLLLALVMLAPSLVRYVPAAGTAAILALVGWRLIEVPGATALNPHGTEPLVWFAAAVAVVVSGPFTAIAVGCLLALVLLVRRLLDFSARLEGEGDWWQLELRGAATFLQTPALARVLKRVPQEAELQVLVGGLRVLDDACLEFLRSEEHARAQAGGRLVVDWAHAATLLGARTQRKAAS
jgi:MFS superfamily sulfate permease-like transporter